MAEEANLAEIQRLAATAAEMQAQLAFRPTRADVDDLAAAAAKLREELCARDQLVERLRANEAIPTSDKAVATSSSLEDLRIAPASPDACELSAEIDEMFRLDYEDDDEETDSAATEINKDESSVLTERAADVDTEAEAEAEADTSLAASEPVRLDDEQRLQLTLRNGSLHALEEELVRAKERWAEAAADKARLAAQLAQLQSKPAMRLRLPAALLVAALAAALYYLLLPYVS